MNEKDNARTFLSLLCKDGGTLISTLYGGRREKNESLPRRRPRVTSKGSPNNAAIGTKACKARPVFDGRVCTTPLPAEQHRPETWFVNNMIELVTRGLLV